MFDRLNFEYNKSQKTSSKQNVYFIVLLIEKN
jgi:hypothetical protein